MLNLTATLPSTYLRLTVKQVSEMGFDVTDLLIQKGLDPDDLDDPSASLTVHQYCQLIESMLVITNEPELGLLVGKRMMFNTHGVLGFAAVNCENYLQLLNLGQKFLSVRTGQLISIDYDIVGSNAHINMYEYSPDELSGRFTAEVFAAALKNVVNFVSGSSSKILAVNFSFPRVEGSNVAESFFNCPVHYNQTNNYLVVSVETLSEPLTTFGNTTPGQTTNLCEPQLSVVTNSSTYQERVRNIMRERGQQLPSLSMLASRFNMTTRSLHRRLKHDGTSYKRLVEEIKHERAVKMLRQSTHTIQEIAYDLGYTDVANFRRAFKRWENMSPMAYRESVLSNKSRKPF
ncbi:AraC family transcriptional regulator [Veronia pacifica]|uniref:HTH araC/xylS-type domain-containing protein n=1 Tax=Veronia pacifica TaxID=1080227 RepID=A0A1C3EQW1_9GAMM|nr:AraC family transcriptional regulator [Veronia pacifica]ODA35627.1 hypothetical protein A8L45_03135 [Veronia pacifica]